MAQHLESRNKREGHYAGYADGHRRKRTPVKRRAFIWPSSVLARFVMPDDEYAEMKTRLMKKNYF